MSASKTSEDADQEKPDRRQFLRLASISALSREVSTASASVSTELQSQPSPGKPNILIIMSDQHHAAVTKGSGFPLDVMPALDGLAERGARMECAYTPAPLCVPARISMLTGRWPHAHRVRQNSAAAHAVFEKDLFGVVKDLGYRTGLAGKNHTYLKASDLDFWRPYTHSAGWKSPTAPEEVVAFDQWLVHENFADEYEPSPFPAEAQHPYRIVSDALEFIDSTGNRPFALWVSFPEPHNPYQVSEPYFSMFPPEQVPKRGVGPEALVRKDSNGSGCKVWRRRPTLAMIRTGGGYVRTI